MPAAIANFLRLVAVLNGRTRDECLSIVGVSLATFKRHLTALRTLGVRVSCSFPDYRYRVVDPGPFDLQRLQRGLAGEPEPELPRVAGRPYATRYRWMDAA